MAPLLALFGLFGLASHVHALCCGDVCTAGQVETDDDGGTGSSEQKLALPTFNEAYTYSGLAFTTL